MIKLFYCVGLNVATMGFNRKLLAVYIQKLMRTMDHYTI